MATFLYINFLMASELISANDTVWASGEELASENHMQKFLKEIKELDSNGGGVRLCSCPWFPRSHHRD
jgi:hypothetical protein